MEPRLNEPLCNEGIGITNDVFQPNNSKMYMEKTPDITSTFSSTLTLPLHFGKSGLLYPVKYI